MTIRDFALERFFAKYEFSVKYLACASDPDSMSIRELLALDPKASEQFMSMGLGYGDSRGSASLRMAIAALYEGFKAPEVLVHSGAEEAIFAFMNVVLSPGDHVVVHTPAYQSLYEVAVSLGAEVSKWEARESDGWQLDVDELKKLVRPNTKVIVINSPHNPTGASITRDRLDAIVDVAREFGCWLFGDEVYRGLEHSTDKKPSVAELYERGVSLGATAKTYGLAGLRIGWLVTRDRAVLERVAAFKDYLTICSAGPSEFLAEVALRNAETLAERSRDIVRANIELVQSLIDTRSDLFSWVRPEAGTTGFIRFNGGSAEKWCRELLEEKGVLVLPGPLFDFGDTHFRVGLGRSSLKDAIAVSQLTTAENAIPSSQRVVEISALASTSLRLKVSPYLPANLPPTARVVLTGPLYADIPLGKRFDFAMPTKQPDVAERTNAVLLAAVQPFGRMPQVASGWNHICVIDFPEGVPGIVETLSEADAHSEPRVWLCARDTLEAINRSSTTPA
ncbi:MAG: aminotransferase class I/II-fold pyridoxal phosphate-dependent enzyme [Archangium sp.]